MEARRSTLGVAVLNGCIYAVGGFDGSTGLSSAEVFDPRTQDWNMIASMSTRRSSVGVGVVKGVLYAVGGYDGASRQCLASVERYDVNTNTWTPVADMTARRSGAGVGVLNDILFAVGGHEGPLVRKSVESYNTETNTWTPVAEMSFRRRNAGVVVHNGSLYVVGGDDGTSNLSSVEVSAACLRGVVDSTDIAGFSAGLLSGHGHMAHLAGLDGHRPQLRGRVFDGQAHVKGAAGHSGALRELWRRGREQPGRGHRRGGRRLRSSSGTTEESALRKHLRIDRPVRRWRCSCPCRHHNPHRFQHEQPGRCRRQSQCHKPPPPEPPDPESERSELLSERAVRQNVGLRRSAPAHAQLRPQHLRDGPAGQPQPGRQAKSRSLRQHDEPGPPAAQLRRHGIISLRVQQQQLPLREHLRADPRGAHLPERRRGDSRGRQPRLRPPGRHRARNWPHRAAPELLVRQHRPLQPGRPLRHPRALALGHRGPHQAERRQCAAQCQGNERQEPELLQLPGPRELAVAEQHLPRIALRQQQHPRHAGPRLRPEHSERERESAAEEHRRDPENAEQGRLADVQSSADSLVHAEPDPEVVAAVAARQQVAAAVGRERPRLQRGRLQFHVLAQLRGLCAEQRVPSLWGGLRGE